MFALDTLNDIAFVVVVLCFFTVLYVAIKFFKTRNSLGRYIGADHLAQANTYLVFVVFAINAFHGLEVFGGIEINFYLSPENKAWLRIISGVGTLVTSMALLIKYRNISK